MTAQLWRHARIATLADASGWGVIDDGAILTEGEHITWVGRDADLGVARADVQEHDLQGALLTPGLIDCHTHLVYAGDRAAEFEQRLAGASYEAIARAGGGIRSTVAATRAASEDALLALAVGRAKVLVAEGVTTLEIKSGYGLDADTEARCLRVARRLGQTLPLNTRLGLGDGIPQELSAGQIPVSFEGEGQDHRHSRGLGGASDADAFRNIGERQARDIVCRGLGK